MSFDTFSPVEVTYTAALQALLERFVSVFGPRIRLRRSLIGLRLNALPNHVPREK